MIPLGNYQRTDKLIWTAEGLADSKILQQELHFLEGNKHFILNADQINLTYLTFLLTVKVERRKLYLQDKSFYLYQVSIKEVHQFVPDAMQRLYGNHIPVPRTGKLIIGKLSEFIGILTANCCTAILRPFQRCFGANCSFEAVS